MKVDFGPVQEIHEVSWYGNDDPKHTTDENKQDILKAISQLSRYIVRTDIKMAVFYSAALTMMVEFSARAMEEKSCPELIDDTIKDLEAITAQLKADRDSVRKTGKAEETPGNESECVHPINVGT